MKSESDKEILLSIQELYNKLEKNFDKDKQKALQQLFETFLINKEISTNTFSKLEDKIKSYLNDDYKILILSILINKSGIIRDLKLNKSHKQFISELHSSYHFFVVDAMNAHELPRRWKFINTQVHTSKEKGVYFRSKLMTCDNDTFIFESYPDDYFILLDHLLKNFANIKVSPTKPVIDKLNSMKLLIEETINKLNISESETTAKRKKEKK